MRRRHCWSPRRNWNVANQCRWRSRVWNCLRGGMAGSESEHRRTRRFSLFSPEVARACRTWRLVEPRVHSRLCTACRNSAAARSLSQLHLVNFMKLSAFLAFLVSFSARLALAQSLNTTTQLDEVVVTASPLGRTLFEQAQPVSILSGDELKLRLEPTLGETLAHTPGVSSTYFGPAASRPIIRGLDADRIRVLQNGSNTIDASATSVDHAVSFDPVSIETLEIVRGPATLLYGPNAIGGVVNAIDNRIPDERIEKPVRGTVEGKYGSVNLERGEAFTLEGGLLGLNWHFEGYKRAADELHIPGFARSARLRERDPLPDAEREAKDVLPNSDLRTEGLSGGLSHVWDKGFIGAAYSGFHSNYGTVAEREVTIDAEQRRFDVRGAFFEPIAQVKSVRYSFNYSDYEHTEFEGALTGTKFENEGYDARIEIAHQKVGQLEGVVGYESEKSDFSALGEEGFLPPVETLVHSGFVFEELTLSPQWRVEAGARFDHATVDADAAEGFGPERGRNFDNVSGSLGVIFTPVESYAIALNASLVKRAPTYQELFANGPHVATNTFEIGDPGLRSEKAFSLDLSIRKKLGRVTGAVTGFYYRFTDFIRQFATGEFVAGDEDDLPVFAYGASDAEFVGGEAEITFHLIEPAAADEPSAGKDVKSVLGLASAPVPRRQALDLVLKADFVHAQDIKNNEPLPRIPPFGASAGLNYRWDRFTANVEGEYAAHQNRISRFDLATDSYFLVSAGAGYKLAVKGLEADLYVKGVNLTNEEARLHTSFLKDIAPLQGRGIVVGLKASF
jgi:iron complex outermembrane receptor protein